MVEMTLVAELSGLKTVISGLKTFCEWSSDIWKALTKLFDRWRFKQFFGEETVTGDKVFIVLDGLYILNNA